MGYNCSVYGCKSDLKNKKDLNFHRFPRDERRQSWINACQRPDLNAKSIEQLYNKFVCSLHFERWMYMNKKLKDSAVPILNLPSASLYSMSTQTEVPKTEIIKDLTTRGVQQEVDIASAGVYAVIPSSSSATQTTKKLTDHSPRKRKLRRQVKSCTKKLKLIEDCKSTDVTREQFFQGCDKFLSPNLRKIVKAQTNLKPSSKSNGYSKEFKLFCLKSLLCKSKCV